MEVQESVEQKVRVQPSLSDEEVLAIMLSQGYDIYGPRFRVVYKERMIYGPNFVFTAEELAAMNGGPQEEPVIETEPEIAPEPEIYIEYEETGEDEIPAEDVVFDSDTETEIVEAAEETVEEEIETEPESEPEEPEAGEPEAEPWLVLDVYEPEPGWERVVEIPSITSDVYDILQQYDIYINSIQIQEQEPMVRMDEVGIIGTDGMQETVSPDEPESFPAVEPASVSTVATIFEEPEVIEEEKEEIPAGTQEPTEAHIERETAETLVSKILSVLDWRIAAVGGAVVLVLVVLICSGKKKSKKKEKENKEEDVSGIPS